MNASYQLSKKNSQFFDYFTFIFKKLHIDLEKE